MESGSLFGLARGGRILFVDDRYDDAIQAAIAELLKKGMPVHYWNGKDEFPETIRNVRVVVLDLDLLGLGFRPAGPECYYPAAEAISKIPGPSLVVIMAIDFIEKDPENLRDVYRDQYGRDFPGFILGEGLKKDDEMVKPTRLGELVAKAIDEEKVLDLVLLWEASLDRAKDQAMKELIREEIENTIVTLIQSTSYELGVESVARELVMIMMRLVSRSTCEAKEFGEFERVVLELNKRPSSASPNPFLYNRLKFYRPRMDENVWTGDIFRDLKEQGYYRYGIILTPQCDLAQRKTTSLLVCWGFALKEEYLDDKLYPPYRVDHVVAGKLAKGASFNEVREYVKCRYFGSKLDLPSRFYPVRHFHDDSSKQPFSICFDFNNVQSVFAGEIENSKRICRLDSPFVEDMLQKHGSLAFRIGTPGWD